MVTVQRTTVAPATIRRILHRPRRYRRRRLHLRNFRLPPRATMVPAGAPTGTTTTTLKSSMAMPYSVFTIGIPHGFKVTSYHRLRLHLRRRCL